MSNIVAIDSFTGLMPFGGKDDGHVEVKHSRFYGSKDMPNKDCPDDDQCGQCMDKTALWLPVFGGHSAAVFEAP